MGDEADLRARYESWLAQKAQAFRQNSPEFRRVGAEAVSAYQRTKDNVDAWAREKAQSPLIKPIVQAHDWALEKAQPVAAWADREVPAVDAGEVQQMKPVDVEGPVDAKGGLQGTSPVDKGPQKTQAIGAGHETPEWLKSYMAQGH